MTDVTRLLDVAGGGDRQAAADLRPLMYAALRKLAAARMPDIDAELVQRHPLPRIRTHLPSPGGEAAVIDV